jgi:hypothetical protein
MPSTNLSVQAFPLSLSLLCRAAQRSWRHTARATLPQVTSRHRMPFEERWNSDCYRILGMFRVMFRGSTRRQTIHLTHPMTGTFEEKVYTICGYILMKRQRAMLAIAFYPQIILIMYRPFWSSPRSLRTGRRIYNRIKPLRQCFADTPRKFLIVTDNGQTPVLYV